MKARRTHESNRVFELEGGTEDNSLWLCACTEGGHPVLNSVWEPTPDERARIAAGENVELSVWGEGHPPVAMSVVSTPLGAAPA